MVEVSIGTAVGTYLIHSRTSDNEAVLTDVIEKLEADTQRTRNEGLEDLKRILSQDRDTSRLNELKDEGYHKVFDSIFRIVKTQKPVWIRSKNVARNTTASRLSVAASALRLAVEIGATSIKHKTAYAVLDHIVGSLPCSDQGYCAPLQNDYLKIFRALLEVSSHGEHLRPKQWQSFVDFLLAYLACEGEDAHANGISSTTKMSSNDSRSTEPLSVRMSHLTPNRVMRASEASSIDEAIMSLKLLTSITNAPIMSKAPELATGLTPLLTNVTRSQETIVETINNVLQTSLTEDIHLAKGLISNLLPSIRRLWTTRSSSLREQLLITLCLSVPLFYQNGYPALALPQDALSPLLDSLKHESCRRAERDLLQPDDILCREPSDRIFRLRTIAPVPEISSSISNWMTLYVMAALFEAMDARSVHELGRTEPVDAGPRKRPKLASPLSELLADVHKGPSSSRLLAVQLLSFLTAMSAQTHARILESMETLATLLAGDDTTVLCWTQVLLSELCCGVAARHESCHSAWRRIWLLASRNLSASPTCRTASLLLGTMLQTQVIDSSESLSTIDKTIFADGSNGPSAMSDAAVQLWSAILTHVPAMTVSSFQQYSKKCLSWLSSLWTLPTVLDRIHNAHLARQLKSENLFELLMAIVGQQVELDLTNVTVISSPVYRALSIFSDARDFVKVLIASAEDSEATTHVNDKPTRVLTFDSSSSLISLKLVLDLLDTKLRMFRSTWNTYIQDRPSNISDDLMQIVTTLCIAANGFCFAQSPETRDMCQSTLGLITEFWHEICSFAAAQDHDTRQRLLLIIASNTVRLRFRSTARSIALAKHQLPLTKSVYDLMLEDTHGGSSHSQSDFDTMDITDSFGSQSAQMLTDNVAADNVRRYLPYLSDSTQIRGHLMMHLTVEVAAAHQTDAAYLETGPLISDYLLSLSPSKFLTARLALVSFFAVQPIISRSTACQILERLAQVCLQADSLERCEAALCLCLDILISFVRLWASANDDIAAVAADIYGWFLRLIDKGFASFQVSSRIGSMLAVVLETNATFTSRMALRSPRTGLLHMLKSSEYRIKYGLKAKLSLLFEHFVLTEHNAIFDDVVENLPSDPECHAAMAVRLAVFSRLAVEWHTVLRLAVYSIFETAARVPRSAALAKCSIVQVAQAMRLEGPKSLLRLFSSQLLYTWLEHESVESLPFSSFGYACQRDLIADLQDELIAQVAMRTNLPESEKLSSILATPWVDMLRTSFARAEAYVIAKDISVPRDNEKEKSSESFVRKALGADSYLKMIKLELPSIIAVLLASLGDDRGIDKALDRYPEFADAKAVYGAICARGQSILTALQAAQQPSFRAKYFLDELDFLCKRVGLEMSSLFTPAFLTYLFRHLFDSAVPSLGPLHACSVLRKMRILVAIGAPHLKAGYVLEMVLHNLRPFLTNFHCSEDAIGLFSYLLESSITYLKSHLAFLASISVSTFAELSKFVKTDQDSTTQSSQFKSTMSKVERFHDWLKRFVTNIPSGNDGRAHRRFQTLATLSSSASSNGSNKRGTAEGDLILALLRDQADRTPLLSNENFQMAIRIICADFTVVPTGEEDILCDSDMAASISPVLSRIVQATTFPHPFRVWAAQGLGRAYGLPQSFRALKRHSDSMMVILPNSHANIIRALEMLLRNHEPTLAGTAERTLQAIASTLNAKERLRTFGDQVQHDVLDQLSFALLTCPPVQALGPGHDPGILEQWESSVSCPEWASKLTRALSAEASYDPVLNSLDLVLHRQPMFAIVNLPSITHAVLAGETTTARRVRQSLSSIFSEGLSSSSSDHVALIIQVLLYLRQMPVHDETNMAERNNWLDIDYGNAARAAIRIELPVTALLFLEILSSSFNTQNARASGRHSAAKVGGIAELLPGVLRRLEDPDFFYGFQEQPTISSLAKKLAHEGTDYKNVSFQSALFDSSIKTTQSEYDDISEYKDATFSALSAANLDGLAKAVRLWSTNTQSSDGLPSPRGHSTISQEWDVAPLSIQRTQILSLTDMFTRLASASNVDSVVTLLDKAVSSLLELIPDSGGQSRNRSCPVSVVKTLAVISETRELYTAESFKALSRACDGFEGRAWDITRNFVEISPILVGREQAMSTLKNSESLRKLMGIQRAEAQLLEARIIGASLRAAEKYQSSQFCLNRGIHMSRLSELASTSNVRFEVAAQYLLARTMREQGESLTSIQLLQGLSERADLEEQHIKVSRVEVLADLSYQVAEARLQKPDEIVERYIRPAIKELRGKSDGADAGRVFHIFAAFCDQQLQNPDDQEEFTRIESIRLQKENEIRELEELIRKSSGKLRDSYKGHLRKAKTWFQLDDEEYNRLASNRHGFVIGALKHYLLSMKACDAYANDVVRFLALWLNQSNNEAANKVVSKHIAAVPSWKFAPLMNQLSSRVSNRDDDFQEVLTELLYRICCEHPHHSLFQMFATSKSSASKNDEVAIGRKSAAAQIAERVRQHPSTGGIWVAIHNSAIAYVRLANEPIPEKKVKPGSKLPLRDVPAGMKMEQTIHDSSIKIPPPTMKIELRADRNYSSIPIFANFEPTFSIAGGISAPKIVSLRASDGSRHKMLLKGGNDDLRQDSIMEQVFEQVSNLLRDHHETRRRQLGIRTYKVIPLTPNVGIIEFVQNTVPLHEYLLPAHQRYFPKDYKPNRCRKDIGDAQSKPLAQRIQAYKTVCEHFHPVMRFFFMEHFLDPDEWFEKRRNYSRSTAAISILGHVLGLGDRHGHNILLDEKSGEVVHIDLGVAFEAGRVLPVPEVVPFRLTRDLVDGMGLTGVEGVFRRCCNFTLEALRLEQASIMTILDVLRYDPLYSWSLSPLRLARMQEQQELDALAAAATATAEQKQDNASVAGGADNVGPRSTRASSVVPSATAGRYGPGPGLGFGAASAYDGTTALGNKRDTNEPGEADRALTVVARKLGKSLSVEATVNELIQQATDEKNLACLYSGWAAYA